jgi:Ser/Thr protein kinase RdoA (MazF antagonist)
MPLPVVARIASGSSFDFTDGVLERELIVARHLAKRDAPAVWPIAGSALYLDGECAVTLWALIEGRPVESAADERLAADALRQVHAALASLELELPPFLDKVDSCHTILWDPAEAPALRDADRMFLRERYTALREALGKFGGVWRPIHGDTHLGNVLISDAGAIWLDLESVCRGPVEWDVVNLPERCWPTFGGLDAELLRLLVEVRSLCVAVWCWAAFDRSAASAEAAVYHLDRLRER